MGTPAAYLESHRRVLLADLAGLEQPALDWCPFPDAFPIARSLLHVAAFELAVAAAATPAAHPGRLRELGARVAPGLERPRQDAGSRELTFYLQLLAAVREETLRRIPTLGGAEATVPDLRPSLAGMGLAEPRRGEVAASLARDLRPNEGLPFDLVRALTEHESYHRGQITLLKYLWRRQAASPG